MAWAGLVLAGASAVFSLDAANKSAKASRLEGQRTRVLKEFEAAQLEQNAGQAIAASQRDAIEVKRQSDLLESRAVAVAASSGGSVSDTTTTSLLATLDNYAAYEKAVALYSGEDKARAMRVQAKASRYEGWMAEELGGLKSDAYRTAGIATALGSGASMYEKYGRRSRRTSNTGSNDSGGAGSSGGGYN